MPLRAIATLAPEWQTSRIVRRNGVRTLTIRAFPKPGIYASKILEQAMPKIKALQLPAGYRIYYGGEMDNQGEMFPQMVVALAISLLAIFLILLVQFRTISEPLVVMASIPLTLFGAMFGLVVTHNPFGFTSFMGVISPVRHRREKRHHPGGLLQRTNRRGGQSGAGRPGSGGAAAAADLPYLHGRRRGHGADDHLRVEPLGPLASVMAFGLIFSMFFTLLVVPVLFVVVKSRSMKERVRQAVLPSPWRSPHVCFSRGDGRPVQSR